MALFRFFAHADFMRLSKEELDVECGQGGVELSASRDASDVV